MPREDGKKTARKFPLLAPDGSRVENLNQAKEAADVLRNDRRERKLPASGHKPKFADYEETYFAHAWRLSERGGQFLRLVVSGTGR